MWRRVSDFSQMGEYSRGFECTFDAVFGIKIEESRSLHRLEEVAKDVVVVARGEVVNGERPREVFHDANEPFVVGFDGLFEAREQVSEESRRMSPCVDAVAAGGDDDHSSFPDDLIDEAVAFEDGFV